MDNSPLIRWNFNADSTVLLLKLSGTLDQTLLKEERNKASMLTHTGISEDICLPKQVWLGSQKQVITSQWLYLYLLAEHCSFLGGLIKTGHSPELSCSWTKYQKESEKEQQEQASQRAFYTVQHRLMYFCFKFSYHS